MLSNTGKRETSGWSDGSERRRRLNRSVSFFKLNSPRPSRATAPTAALDGGAPTQPPTLMTSSALLLLPV